MRTLLRATALLVAAAGFNVAAQNVKITPLGSHAGELCSRDRATIFEDPTGIRILYDAGQSVTGADDARLGKIDVVILSHAHGDHIGDQKLKALGEGSCDGPPVVSAAPNSNTAEIAAAKNAAIVMVSQLANFVGRKVETVRGKPTTQCPLAAGDIVAPVTAPCLAPAQTGGTRTIRASASAPPVEITVVPAAHDNTVPIALLGEAQRKALEADGMSLAAGPPSGYVIRFTNGLVVYMTGDSGIHAEMQTIARDFYKAHVMQLNYGSSALSPAGAAYVIDKLVQPAAVILSHVNEAATESGKFRAGTRSAALVELVKGRSIHPALSGRTMEFDGKGKCVAGC